MSDSVLFGASVDNSRLPSGWSISRPYSSCIRLDAPEGYMEQVILVYMGDSELTYRVSSMVPTKMDQMVIPTEEPSFTSFFTEEENAISYAIGLAERLDNERYRPQLD